MSTDAEALAVYARRIMEQDKTIAALLDALEEAVEMLGCADEGMPWETVNKARAAIAAAKGKP